MNDLRWHTVSHGTVTVMVLATRDEFRRRSTYARLQSGELAGRRVSITEINDGQAVLEVTEPGTWATNTVRTFPSTTAAKRAARKVS